MRAEHEAVARSALRLGVRIDANPRVIRQAYLQKVKLWHPDRDGSEDARSRFVESREAYLTMLAHVRGTRAAAREVQLPRCERCGTRSGQLSIPVRLRVTSLLATRVERRAAINCERCARRAALGANLHSGLFGWWGLLGPSAVLRALRTNLATRPAAQAVSLRLALHGGETGRSRPPAEPGIAFALLNAGVTFAPPALLAATIWWLT